MSAGAAELSHSIDAEQATYVRNLCALWQYDAPLAMAIEAVHPLDVPAIEAARDGAATLRMSAGGRQIYLHSKYKPLDEAAAWAAENVKDDKYVYVVSGFGLGHHVKALFEKLPGDGTVIVAEPNVALLRAALAAVDVSEALGTGRLMIFNTLDRGALVDRLEPRSALFVSGVQFAAHGPSMQVTPEFQNAFMKLVTEFVAFTRTGFITLMLNNVATCRNVANNIGRYVTTPPLDLIGGANVFAGKPAILVAAGPSLQRNMHLLHELKGKTPAERKVVIIAVQTMLKPLLAAGIEPDFVTSLDYNTVSTRFFENLEEAGSSGHVHLVAEAKANFNVLDVFTGTMTLTQNDFADRLLRDLSVEHGGGGRAGLKAGATVAHLSFYLAEYLGCDPLIMIGQDLGFVDGLYYKPGVAIHETWAPELGRFNSLETKEWERIVRSRPILRKIPDVDGNMMYTEEQFFVYLQQFERDFAATRTRVIDATEGGAKKQGVTVMTLREAIDRYCSDGATKPRSDGGWKHFVCDGVSRLQAAREALQRRRAAAQEMIDTCDQTVPVLEEMIKHQADAERMNKLFVEVDRLRSKVGSDPQTFEMVCHLNTIGELRRFQHDLQVKTAEKDSAEKQRRQLSRDVDYVKNLRIGAERLLEILDEATARLDKQIEAARQGEPWPRDVAGGGGAKANG